MCHKIESIITLPVSIIYCKTIYLYNLKWRVNQTQLSKRRQAILASSLEIKKFSSVDVILFFNKKSVDLNPPVVAIPHLRVDFIPVVDIPRIRIKL